MTLNLNQNLKKVLDYYVADVSVIHGSEFEWLSKLNKNSKVKYAELNYKIHQ